jgi:NCS1 family nucleobase:cation symporter-1
VSDVTAESSLVIERRSIDYVPPEERHGRARDLFTIWFGSNIMPLTVITGALATAAYGLSFWWSLVAILLGNLGGGLFMALHSAQGPRLGVPQMIQSRGQFGSLGAVIVVAVSVIMYVGFFATNLFLGGESLNELVSSISVDTGIVICAVVSLAITIFGYDLIHYVNRWASLVFGAVLLLAFVWVIFVHGVGGGFFSKGGFDGAPFLEMTSVAALWQIAYAPYVSDYSRYMPVDEGVSATFWASYWGCCLGSILPMVLGAIVGLASPNPDTIAGMHDLTGSAAWLIMVVFALGIMDTNAINLYGGMLCSITVAESFWRRWLPGARVRALVSVVIVVISLYIAVKASANFVTNYTNFILFLLYLLIPWTAINLVDFYLLKHGNYDVNSFFEPDGGIYGRVAWVALVVYVAGFLLEIPFMNTSLYEGPIAKSLNGADIAWLVGLAVISPVYYFAAKAFAPAGPVAAPEPAAAEPPAA